MKKYNAGYGLIAGGIVTLAAVIVVAALYIINRLAIVRGRTLDQVQDARWNVPILAAVLLAIALVWLVWMVRRFGLRHIATVVTAMVAVALLIVTPLLAWQAGTASRELTVTNMTCDPEALRTTGGDPLMDCQENAVDTIVHISALESDDTWTPDSMEANTRSRFGDLPAGGWDARLTVDGPAETTAVHVVDVSGDRPVRLATFTPRFDEETARMIWSGPMRFPGGADNIRVLFYLSEQPASPSASLRFNVRACTGQSIRTFNAAECESYASSVPVVMEAPDDTARTWRYPINRMEGGTQVVSNLEARSYTFTPDLTSVQMLSQSADVLIIPAPLEQVESNAVAAPGVGQFQVEIAENTGPQEYVVYIFPSGPTYAVAD